MLDWKIRYWLMDVVNTKETRNPKVIWEEACHHPSWQNGLTCCICSAHCSADESNHSATGMLHPHHSTTLMHTILHSYASKSLTLKTAPSPSAISTPSNTIPRTTPLTTPNSIQMQPAIFSQFTHWTQQQTDRWAGRQLGSNTLCSIVLLREFIRCLLFFRDTIWNTQEDDIEFAWLQWWTYWFNC